MARIRNSAASENRYRAVRRRTGGPPAQNPSRGAARHREEIGIFKAAAQRRSQLSIQRERVPAMPFNHHRVGRLHHHDRADRRIPPTRAIACVAEPSPPLPPSHSARTQRHPRARGSPTATSTSWNTRTSRKPQGGGPSFTSKHFPVPKRGHQAPGCKLNSPSGVQPKIQFFEVVGSSGFERPGSMGSTASLLLLPPPAVENGMHARGIEMRVHFWDALSAKPRRHWLPRKY